MPKKCFQQILAALQKGTDKGLTARWWTALVLCLEEIWVLTRARVGKGASEQKKKGDFKALFLYIGKMREWEHKGISKIYQWKKDRTKGCKLAVETINLERRRGLAYRNGQILSTHTWICLFPVALRNVYKG